MHPGRSRKSLCTLANFPKVERRNGGEKGGRRNSISRQVTTRDENSNTATRPNSNSNSITYGASNKRESTGTDFFDTMHPLSLSLSLEPVSTRRRRITGGKARETGERRARGGLNPDRVSRATTFECYQLPLALPTISRQRKLSAAT